MAATIRSAHATATNGHAPRCANFQRLTKERSAVNFENLLNNLRARHDRHVATRLQAGVGAVRHDRGDAAGPPAALGPQVQRLLSWRCPALWWHLYFAAPWRYLAADRLTAVHVADRDLHWLVGLRHVDGLFPLACCWSSPCLFLVFTWLSGIPDREDSADFYTLILGGTLGMCLMASANHLFMVFLGVEMASVPSYALAGMLKGRRESSEAALNIQFTVPEQPA